MAYPKKVRPPLTTAIYCATIIDVQGYVIDF